MNRLPPSSRPPTLRPQTAAPSRPAAPTRRKTGTMQKISLPHAHEHGEETASMVAPQVEAHGEPPHHSEHAARDAVRQGQAEAQEKKEQAKDKAKEGGKKDLRQEQKTGQVIPKGAQLAQGKAAFLQKKAASSAADARAQALTSSSYTSLSPVGSLQNKLAGSLARAERPPDAYALLKEAKEQGVLFQEDRERDGHSEDQEDPELAAAVEECIRRCFGVRGVMRIGPGKDEKAQPIIVVVAAQGFTEASFQKVPEKVDRFPTFVAIPFDLLPLRREL